MDPDLKHRLSSLFYRAHGSTDTDYKRRDVTPDMYLGALPEWAQCLAERLYSEGRCRRSLTR